MDKNSFPERREADYDIDKDGELKDVIVKWRCCPFVDVVAYKRGMDGWLIYRGPDGRLDHIYGAITVTKYTPMG